MDNKDKPKRKPGVKKTFKPGIAYTRLNTMIHQEAKDQMEVAMLTTHKEHATMGEFVSAAIYAYLGKG